jgi:hypothetical protein
MSDHLIAEANRHAKALLNTTPKMNSKINPDRLALALALEQVDQLERENVALRADKERLDWRGIANQLKRKNAALRAALASAEVGLKHALMMEPGDPFKRIAAITAALDAVRAACCSATGPSNDPEKLAHKIPAPL